MCIRDRYVTMTERVTVLSNKKLQVSTVEHAMSALYAMGVDNCLIEVNAPEIPIFDGSAVEYIHQIKKVGVVEQAAVREVYVVKRKIEVKGENGISKLTLLPDNSFGLHVLIACLLYTSATQLAPASEGATAPERPAGR